MAPIWIRCEGSGANSWYCPMCAVPGESIGANCYEVPEHFRRDILAEIERGDFDEERA